MSKSIRISDKLLEQAKDEAETFHRSPPQQIEHWAEIGRVMEPLLSYRTQKTIKSAVTDEEIEKALSLPGTPEGIAKAKDVIKYPSS